MDNNTSNKHIGDLCDIIYDVTHTVVEIYINIYINIYSKYIF